MKHYSHSQLNTWRKCPRKWYFSYIRKIWLPLPGWFSLGNSVDASANAGYREKKKTGKMSPLSFLTDVFMEDHRMRIEETDWRDEKPEDNEKDGLEIVKVFEKDASPNVQPVEIQKRIEVEFDDRDFSFLSYLDLTCEDEVNPDHIMILDHKTSSRVPSAGIGMTDPQMTCYAAMFQFEEGYVPPVALEYFIRPQKTNPARNFREFGTRDQTDIDRWWRDTDATIKEIELAVGANNFAPCPPTIFGQPNRTCSPEQCGYYQMCREGF